LSHVGIFIKGNDFIHAENETTGVLISSLDSDDYSNHYAGARRPPLNPPGGARWRRCAWPLELVVVSLQIAHQLLNLDRSFIGQP
jgi:hypothetical protein